MREEIIKRKQTKTTTKPKYNSPVCVTFIYIFCLVFIDQMIYNLTVYFVHELFIMRSYMHQIVSDLSISIISNKKSKYKQ